MRPFEYEEPRSVAEVVALLAQHGADARLLAGGQSLLILLRQRLVTPAVLVALAAVEGLRRIETGADGALRLGAMTTYRDLARSEAARRHAPLLARAAGVVGSMHIRELGTIGGAICHADPAGDVPTVLMALDGRMEGRGRRGDGEARLLGGGARRGVRLAQPRHGAPSEKAGWSRTARTGSGSRSAAG